MSSINTINPNVAYNYQKVPGLVTSNYQQSINGLTVSMRERTNINRNPVFLFPANFTTPAFGAGSISMGARTVDSVLPDGSMYAGKQITY